MARRATLGTIAAMESHLVDVAATEALGRQLATRLHAGSVLTLSGPLGAGKTTLVRALVAALGGDPQCVSSPTFTLMNVYASQPPVYHVDAYRLERPEQLDGLGFWELAEDGIGIIEWPERILESLPRSGVVQVTLSHRGDGSRIAVVDE